MEWNEVHFKKKKKKLTFINSLARNGTPCSSSFWDQPE